MKRSTFMLIGVGVSSLLIGGGAGYIVARKQLEKVFDEALEKEIRATQQFYIKLYKTDDFETPEKALETLARRDLATAAPETEVTTKETVAVTAMRVYGGENKGPLPQPDPEEEIKNVFERHVEVPESELVQAKFDTGLPRIVSDDEFMANDEEYNQVTLTYYAGDGVLCDEREEAMSQVNQTVGVRNLTEFGTLSGDPNIVYVRNDNLRTYFEIAKSTGSYAREVQGFGAD